MARNKEGEFQDVLINILEHELFPGSIVMKNDATYRQGFPDLILIGPKGFTAILECKKSSKEKYQPNQEYYLAYCENELDHFTATVYPENMEVILDALQHAFLSRR